MRIWLCLILAAGLAAGAGKVAAVNQGSKGVAIRGYDAVGYFTDAQPVKGNPKFSFSWGGALWQFSSAEHLDAFRQDPNKYAPQYGGYCAWAVGHGYTAGADPTVWTIRNGKLYLNYNQDVQKKWSGDIPGWIAKGDANWPKILQEKK